MYAERLRFMAEMLSCRDRCSTEQYWDIMDKIDDWDWEDSNILLLPPHKRLCLTREAQQSSPPIVVQDQPAAKANQSPQPGADTRDPPADDSLVSTSSASASCISKGVLSGDAKAELIAKNKAAALERLREKRSAAEFKKNQEIFEAMQWHY